MSVRVHISPSPEQIQPDNGVGQVVHAQYTYLPACGIDLVSDPDQADVIACHIQQGDLPRVDTLHTHGLYWSGDKGSGSYVSWHHEANRRIVDAARKAIAVTVPSAWVAEPFKRDMRINPVVIGHGIDIDQWEPAESRGYVLWNKNRLGDVCNPEPAAELARRGILVASTFGPRTGALPDNLHIVGTQPHDLMREIVRHAAVYLATTKETFGIGTLEAMAAGVPVLGYRWGGTQELVYHQFTGWLAEPGDIDGLVEGYRWLMEHREEISANARGAAKDYTWERVAQRYADLYNLISIYHSSVKIQGAKTKAHSVSVVITNWNYGRYLNDAIESVQAQSLAAEEIIIVDDGSTDDSTEVLARWQGSSRVRTITQTNQGVAAARNRGIMEAAGPYIVCLDADDRLHPEYLRVCQRALELDRGLGVAYTGLGLIQPDGQITPNAWPPPFDWEAQATPANPPANCIPCAAMFRKTMWERAGGYRQVYAPGEDTEFFTRGLSVGFTARKVSDEALFHYRMHEGSASRTKKYRPIDTWHPWMRDKEYPMAAPASKPPLVRSYSSPAVSIIIPVGPGHARYLPAALDSVLGQECREWECIVVNDTAPEDEEFEGDALRPYPFVTVVPTRFDGKQGPAFARNVGLDAARTPLVLFLDADDYLLPHALRRMLEAYVSSGGKYIYSDWYAMGDDGKLTAHETPDYTQQGWLEHGQHAITALVPTADARGVGGFDARMKGWEDWDFFIKLAISGVCGVRLPEPILVYRQHTGTVRETSLAKKDELLGVLRDRYAAYATGETLMAGCCGGNADALIAAKRALAWEQSPNGQENEPMTIIEPQVVRMEFVGEQRGATSVIGRPSGTVYRGGNNPLDKYQDVDPRDVAFLESLGTWRVVAMPRTVPAPPAELAIEQAVNDTEHQETTAPRRGKR